MSHFVNTVSTRGFTLIELSIVLVIIGLIVGGIMTGQNLIAAAAVRAQITQIEKFNTAANTFYGKYGYLPGDLPAPMAAQFGFVSRAGTAGRGDGNGIIQGYSYNLGTVGNGNVLGGETVFFWEDLSSAHLISDSFSTATDANINTPGPNVTNLSPYIPAAKIGGGNYIAIYNLNGAVYFMLDAVTLVDNNGTMYSNPALTVMQAYNIDKKIDDGLPQTGRAIALYITANGQNFVWAGSFSNGGVPFTIATAGSSTSCFDNGNAAGMIQQYSIEQSNGNGVNCALSLRMQSGD
jgi:prepilin-type N-terminal cleavage/methylation domain-containing protein